ncbi:MAG: carbohydrate ABC transporter permease [Chloroflexi bacterium]|nr:MAG: carbohydrate ABC transporter permease [Chloroflexota bacterium]
MKINRWLNHLVSLGIAGLFLLPLFWMFSASLRAPGLPPPRGIEWIPSPLTFSNYARLFEILPLDRYIFNSLYISTIGVLLTLLTASWAGLGMSLLGKRARLRLLILSAILQIIPITAVWLTRFLLFAWIGVTNSRLPLLAPALMGSSPLFVLLFYWTFRRVDRAIFETAQLDGANLLQIWWKVGLPLARPALMAVGLLSFLYYWNDFITPLLYLRSQSLFTLPVGLLQLQEMDKTNWPLLMAASAVMTIPAVIIFSVLQRALLWQDSAE